METKRDRPALKIGHLARRLGLNVRTLRYNESIGLLPSPPRTEAGCRLYSEEDERRLRFVLQAQELGLSLEEIGRILELGRHGSACDEEVGVALQVRNIEVFTAGCEVNQ